MRTLKVILFFFSSLSTLLCAGALKYDIQNLKSTLAVIFTSLFLSLSLLFHFFSFA